MWGLIVVHSKQVFHFNCVRYNKVPLHSRCVFVHSDTAHLRRLGLGYFLYLFLFSGLEYSLTFLTHQRFKYTR